MNIPNTADFRTAMKAEANLLRNRYSRDCVTAVGRDWFISQLSGAASRHSCRAGAPCGTNARWMLRQILDEVVPKGYDDEGFRMIRTES